MLYVVVNPEVVRLDDRKSGVQEQYQALLDDFILCSSAKETWKRLAWGVKSEGREGHGGQE